jgi:hypothetical protein
VEYGLSYQEELNRAIDYTRSKLLEAKSLNVDITKAIEIFNQVGEVTSTMDFERAFDLLHRCNKKIDTAVDQHIFKIISDCHMQLKQYPKLDFSIVKRHLDEANYLLQNKNYQNALNHAVRCQAEINDIINLNLGQFKQQAEAVYHEIQKILTEAQQEANLDIQDVEDIYNSMNDSLSSAEGIKDYEDVIEYGAAFKNALARAYRRKEKLIEQLESLQKIINKMNLAIENVSQHFLIPDDIKNIHTKSKNAFANKDLEEAEKYAEQCAVKLNELTRNCKPEITFKFLTESLLSDVWNRANISIENTGSVQANDITIELTGPVNVRRIPKIETLGINEKKEFEIGIKFEGAGNVPIDLQIFTKRSWDEQKYTIKHELWLDVVRSDEARSSDSIIPSPEPTKTMATGPGQALACILCKKIIEESTPIVKCDCGTIYHLNCSTEMDFCMKCGNNLKKITPEVEIESEISWD